MDQSQEIKQKTDIVQIISEYTELKRAGRNYKGVCPFHSEKTPSFMVSPELQIYKCFGCQVGGDVYTFLMDLEKIDFPQALKLLADRLGIKLVQQKGFTTFQEKDEIYSLNSLASEFYHYLLLKHPSGEEARTYLKNRGIIQKSIEEFKLGLSPQTPDAVFNFLTKKRGYKPDLLEKAGIVVNSQGRYFDRFRGRIIFPLKDHFGNVCGFSGRIIDGNAKLAKYINSPETIVYKKSKILYGLDQTKSDIKKEGFAVVVEGEIDCISCFQAGIKNVVAIKGSAFTQEQAQLISRFTDKVVLALDADFAGNEAAKRGLDILQKENINVQIASLGEYKDPDEMAQTNPQALKQAVVKTTGVYDFLIELVLKRIDTSSTEGKAQASRHLSPILAKIEDEIVRAACIRKVAQALAVPEEAVTAQIRKQNQNSPGRVLISNMTSKNPEVKNRRELLEEHLVSYLFQNNFARLFEEDVISLVQLPARRRLLEEMKKIYNQKNNPNSLDLSYISNQIPAELKESLSTIALSQVSLQEEGEDKEKEIRRLKNEIELIDTKEKMSILTQKIKSYEMDEESNEVLELEQELTKLSQKVTLLEAQNG